ncbi:MAG: SLC13 family permease [Cyanobacteria bacterium P01_A01_bin.45]
MDNLQAIISVLTLVCIIILAIAEWLNITIAAFLGALFIIFTNILTFPESINYIARSESALGLFFGFMVLTRILEPTKIFEFIATKIVFNSRGKGKILLLVIVSITTIISALLPNTVAVILVAPVIPYIAKRAEVDFVQLMILVVLVANSAGLITLIGDPTTLIISDAININFGEYLLQLSLGGITAVLTIVGILPFLYHSIWNKSIDNLDIQSLPSLRYQNVLKVCGTILGGTIIFVILGTVIDLYVSAAAFALLGAAIASLVAYKEKVDPIDYILQDIDWSILLFFVSIIVVAGALDQTGVVSGLSGLIDRMLQANIAFGLLLLMFCVAIISSFIGNIPLAIIAIPLLQRYIVNFDFTTPPIFTSNLLLQIPPETLFIFYATLFGITIGSNGTLLGATSNIFSANFSDLKRKNLNFKKFIHYGIPVMLLQLANISIYLLLRFSL